MSHGLKIALLSHRGGNIGHDFMAEGIERILKETFGGNGHELMHIEQHRPFEIYPPRHPLRLLNHLPPGRFQRVKAAVNQPRMSMRLWSGVDARLRSADIAIVCGGPNIVSGVHKSADMGLMLHHQIGGVARARVPVLNLSVGSCYPVERVPATIEDEHDREFHRRTCELSQVTSVRDEVARAHLAELGFECPLIPCPASAMGGADSGFHFRRQPAADQPIVINYQLYGANDDWGQNVCTEQWRETVRTLVSRLRRRHPVFFICHSRFELQTTRQAFPDFPTYFPKTVAEYASLIAAVGAGLCNRLHAALALAAIGVSAVLVGTDTRMRTAEQLGLPTFFVKAVNADMLEDEIERRYSQQAADADRLWQCRTATVNAYAKLMRTALEGNGK
jgi:hypothetical protein